MSDEGASKTVVSGTDDDADSIDKAVLLAVVEDMADQLEDEECDVSDERKEMLRQFASALSLDSSGEDLSAESLRFMASFALHVVGRKDAALTILEEAAGVFTEDCATLIALANLKDQVLKQTNEAEVLYRSCLKLEPGHPEASQNLGAILLERAKSKDEGTSERADLFREATTVLTAADSVAPGYTSYNLACVAAIFNKDESESRRWLEHAEKYDMLPSSEIMSDDADLSAVSGCPWTFLSEVTAETLALKLESAFAKRCDMRARVLSLRILVTPPNAPSQDWHLDFRANNGDDLQCRTIFVALTDATIDNCTEFFVTRPSVEDRVEKAVHARKRDLRGGPGTLCSPSQRTRSEMNLDTKSADKHSTSPIVVKVKSSEIVGGIRSLRMRKNEIVCVNTSRLPHRRGASLASSDTRIVLNVDFTMVPEDRVLCDRPPSKIFVDDDWYASLSKCGVVPRAITDNLHSEVILRVI
eukprot:g284.t1